MRCVKVTECGEWHEISVPNGPESRADDNRQTAAAETTWIAFKQLRALERQSVARFLLFSLRQTYGRDVM